MIIAKENLKNYIQDKVMVKDFKGEDKPKAIRNPNQADSKWLNDVGASGQGKTYKNGIAFVKFIPDATRSPKNPKGKESVVHFTKYIGDFIGKRGLAYANETFNVVRNKQKNTYSNIRGQGKNKNRGVVKAKGLAKKANNPQGTSPGATWLAQKEIDATCLFTEFYEVVMEPTNNFSKELKSIAIQFLALEEGRVPNSAIMRARYGKILKNLPRDVKEIVLNRLDPDIKKYINKYKHFTNFDRVAEHTIGYIERAIKKEAGYSLTKEQRQFYLKGVKYTKIAKRSLKSPVSLISLGEKVVFKSLDKNLNQDTFKSTDDYWKAKKTKKWATKNLKTAKKWIK